MAQCEAVCQCCVIMSSVHFINKCRPVPAHGPHITGEQRSYHYYLETSEYCRGVHTANNNNVRDGATLQSSEIRGGGEMSAP